MELRKATKEDAPLISKLIRISTELNPNNYSKEQQAAWIEYNTTARTEKYLKDRDIYCAFQNGELIGTIALKGNEVLGFYVDFNRRGQGVGSILLSYLEEKAIEKKLVELYLSSTPSAEKFYKSKGFVPVRVIVVSIFGVDYPEVEMKKVLNHAGN